MDETKVKWRPLKGAQVWRPQPDETLTGIYRGLSQREGQYGYYEVMVLEVDDAVYTISGSVLINLIEVNGLQPGTLTKVHYHGKVQIRDTDRWYKKFSASVADVTKVAPSDT